MTFLTILPNFSHNFLYEKKFLKFISVILLLNMFKRRNDFNYMAFNKEFLINEQITAKTVLLIDEDGVKHENLPIETALKIAEERDLDLALVSPNPKMPVCKLMNYSKFKYEQTKKEKEQRKNQKTIVVKEVQLSYRIEQHDFNTKLKMAKKFLSSGNKVNVVLRLKGRERMFAENAVEIMERFANECSDVGTISGKITTQNNVISMTLIAL